MAKIFVSRKVPGESLDRLSAGNHEVKTSEFDRPLTQEEFLERAKDSEGVLCLLTDKIDGEVMDAIGPELRIISNYAVGFDNINVVDATKRGIIVTNTPSDEVNEAVAEHTWALILSLFRRIVEADEAVRKGAYKGWEPDQFLGSGLKGKVLGIIGLGRIGTMVARRAAGYEMEVIYNKRSPDPEVEKELGIVFSDLNSLLAKSDIVSLHVPLTEETRHLINKDTLSHMKTGSCLINTARGPIIYEHELVEALREGRLKGAALDVFENEPDIDPELINMQNVILTPHIASATWEAREKMGSQAVDALLNFFSGKKPDNIVNEDVWQEKRS